MELSAYHPFRSAKAKEQYLALYDQQAKKWPILSESRMVPTAFGETFMRVSGAVDAQPLVLIPGYQATSLCWFSNIEALSENYRTYAVDNIYDNGYSVYTRAPKGSDDYTSWLDELFTALELGDKINLMGISYGGWLTSQYALRFPNRLAKIVLLAPAATVLPVSAGFTLRLLPSIVSYRHFSRSFMGWFFADTSRAEVNKYSDEQLIVSQCFKPKRFIVPNVLTDKEIQGLKVPCLFIVGEHEKLYPAQKAVQRLNMIAPQIKTETIPQAGHDLIVVQAEMVNRKILDFLEKP